MAVSGIASSVANGAGSNLGREHEVTVVGHIGADGEPVLRYVARDLIRQELTALSGADPSASSPAA
jgi:hypothetical protein